MQKAQPSDIGVYLGFRGRVPLDGEGIGRFTYRLIDGLLRSQDNVVIHIATTPENTQEIEGAFEGHKLLYGERIRIHATRSIHWINKNIPAQAWIVPYVGLESAASLKSPIVICLHDLVYLHFKDEYYHPYRNFFDRFHKKAQTLANRASAVVFSSEFIRQNEGYTFLGLAKEKTRVIPLAAPKEEYDLFGLLDETEFRERYQLRGDYLVYPSAIRRHKNHERLVEAFLRITTDSANPIHSLQLVLTDHYLQSPMKTEIHELLSSYQDESIQRSVVFAGRMPASHLPSLYRYARGTIIPTLFEGSCPFPLLESLHMDTPVAVSDIQVTREAIADMNAFITFNPYSVREIEMAIHRLANSYHALLAREKFAASKLLNRTWPMVASDYYSLIREII